MEEVNNAVLVIQQWWLAVRPKRQACCMMCNCVLETDGLCDDCDAEQAEEYSGGENTCEEEFSDDHSVTGSDETDDEDDDFMETYKRFVRFTNQKSTPTYTPQAQEYNSVQQYRKEMAAWAAACKKHKEEEAIKERVDRMYQRIKRAQALKPELIAGAFAPSKVEKWLETGGDKLVDEMFGDE